MGGRKKTVLECFEQLPSVLNSTWVRWLLFTHYAVSKREGKKDIKRFVSCNGHTNINAFWFVFVYLLSEHRVSLYVRCVHGCMFEFAFDICLK